MPPPPFPISLNQSWPPPPTFFFIFLSTQCSTQTREREREKQRVLPSSLKSNLYHRSSTPSSHSLTSTPTPPKEPRLSVLWALPSEEPNERERKMWRKKKMCLCWFDLGCLGLGMVEVGVDPGGFCYLILVWSWICCPRFDFVFVVIGESFLLWVGKKICLTKIQKFFFLLFIFYELVSHVNIYYYLIKLLIQRLCPLLTIMTKIKQE